MTTKYALGKRENKYIVETNTQERYNQEWISKGIKFEDLPKKVIANYDLRTVWMTEEKEFRNFSETLEYLLEDARVLKIKREDLPDDCVPLADEDQRVLNKITRMYTELYKIKEITDKL